MRRIFRAEATLISLYRSQGCDIHDLNSARKYVAPKGSIVLGLLIQFRVGVFRFFLLAIFLAGGVGADFDAGALRSDASFTRNSEFAQIPSYLLTHRS